MGKVRIAYSHLGIGSVAVCGCHDQAGGKLRAYNEPPAVVGGTGPDCSRIGGSSSLFYPTGSGVWILDLGAMPASNRGTVVISQALPSGTSVTHNLKGSTTGAFAGEETDLGTVTHGSTFVGQYRYFKLTSTLTSNSQRDSSPLVVYFSVLYPRGYLTTGSLDLLLDVDFTPEYDGSWEIDSIIPSGSSLALAAQASNEIDSVGRLIGDIINIGAIAHASAITIRKRFYGVHAVFNSDANQMGTPRLTRIKANFPNG
ncbi:MAG TPA: hypothetical protein VIL61_09135 [Nitrospiria bacterium]